MAGMAIFALPCRSKRCSTVRGSKISPCWVRFDMKPANASVIASNGTSL